MEHDACSNNIRGANGVQLSWSNSQASRGTLFLCCLPYRVLGGISFVLWLLVLLRCLRPLVHLWLLVLLSLAYHMLLPPQSLFWHPLLSPLLHPLHLVLFTVGHWSLVRLMLPNVISSSPRSAQPPAAGLRSSGTWTTASRNDQNA